MSGGSFEPPEYALAPPLIVIFFLVFFFFFGESLAGLF